MRSIFFLALSALAVFAAAADNAFNVPPGGYKFVAGQPTTLTWTPTTPGTVTLKLQKGSDFTPDSGIVLAASIKNSGSFTFTPPASLSPGSDYTVEIIDDADPTNINFTPKFSISGTTGTASSLSGSATISTATTSASSTLTSSSTSSSSSTTTSQLNSTSTLTTTSTSSSSSSTSSSTGASQTTSVPNPNAAMSLKLPGGMLVAVLGVMALL